MGFLLRVLAIGLVALAVKQLVLAARRRPRPWINRPRWLDEVVFEL